MGEGERRILASVSSLIRATRTGRELLSSVQRQMDFFKEIAEPLAKAIRQNVSFALEKANLLENLSGLLAFTDAMIAPGTFFGDFMVVAGWDGAHSDDEIQAALTRLASKYFYQKAVFFPERWQFLQSCFHERLANTSYESAWRELCAPALFIAVRDLRGDIPSGKLYPFLRRETRKNIERELLSGQTLDEHRGRGDVPLPDDGTPESLALEAQVAQELVKWDEMRRVLLSLAELSEPEREALCAYYEGIPDEEIAAREGVIPATIRQRRHRAKEKISSQIR